MRLLRLKRLGCLRGEDACVWELVRAGQSRAEQRAVLTKSRESERERANDGRDGSRTHQGLLASLRLPPSLGARDLVYNSLANTGPTATNASHCPTRCTATHIQRSLPPGPRPPPPGPPSTLPLGTLARSRMAQTRRSSPQRIPALCRRTEARPPSPLSHPKWGGRERRHQRSTGADCDQLMHTRMTDRHALMPVIVVLTGDKADCVRLPLPILPLAPHPSPPPRRSPSSASN